MDTTQFRLFLDTRYPVQPWPFRDSWQQVLRDMPAALPGGVADFDLALPEDTDNRTHGTLPREHALSRTEMAVYRDGDALIVLARQWPGAALPERFAPPIEDSMTFIWMATLDAPAVNLRLQRSGEQEGWILDGVYQEPIGEQKPTARAQLTEGYATCCVEGDGYWAAGVRIDLAAIPALPDDAAELRFTAGRLWGETNERCCWATSVVWCPRPEEMGTLQLPPATGEPLPSLYRADLAYDAETEQSMLTLQLAHVAPGTSVPVTVSFGDEEVSLTSDGEASCPWPLSDGNNWATVTVAERCSYLIPCEKWSGHRLFARVPGVPWPTLEELKEKFAGWHAQLEEKYVAPGTWATRPDLPKLSLDQDGAFMATPYALACCYLDRQEVYVERVRAACERFLLAQDDQGVFPAYHRRANPSPFENGAYCQGSVGESLILGYRLTGDERFLDGALRAAEAYRLYSLEFNTNYAAFVLWHLSDLYELTGEAIHLERALWYTRHAILRGLTPGGAYPGHNYYTCYGNITLKGLAKLLRVLPPGHDFAPILRERVIRVTNQFLARQCVDGNFEAYYRGEIGRRMPIPGLFEVLRALPEERTALEPALTQMLASPLRGREHLPGANYALAARYLTERLLPVGD